MPKERVYKELLLVPAMTLIKQGTRADWKWASMVGLSLVIPWGEERVEDAVEVVNGKTQMTINQAASLPPPGHLSPRKSMHGFGGPCFVSWGP